jgi:hypothetical protein
LRNILLIASHYPPSNLTSTHRVRLIASHLPIFGWNPIVLTVDERFYEEKLDNRLSELIPKEQRVERVNAFKVTKPRIVGDVGLRAFFQLRKRAIEILSKENIDFVYIFIPSFYLSLLGPLLHRRFGVKYGIDYIDPWVHFFPGSERKLSRHWWSTFFAKILEPLAVKHASLITGVSDSYFSPILLRNPHLVNQIKTTAIPYGWDKNDILALINSQSSKYIFNSNDKIKLVYPGVFLPHSRHLLNAFFKVIKNNLPFFENIEIYFIGTGIPKYNNSLITISDIAKQYNLFNSVIFEYPNRISYFDLLKQISNANGLFVLGSTEAHYTPSKLFNAFITNKPIFAILHERSSGNEIINNSGLGCVFTYNYLVDFKDFEIEILNKFQYWIKGIMSNKWVLNEKLAEKYSIKEMTRKLVNTLNEFY